MSATPIQPSRVRCRSPQSDSVIPQPFRPRRQALSSGHAELCNLQRRDPRYDGRFFTAAKTTGIYCRPVCPAKHPLTRNVAYYPTAASAEAAGVRPCLRCRPETAPFCPAWNGTRSTVVRAMKLINDGALDEEITLALNGGTQVARHAKFFV